MWEMIKCVKKEFYCFTALCDCFSCATGRGGKTVLYFPQQQQHLTTPIVYPHPSSIPHMGYISDIPFFVPILLHPFPPLHRHIELLPFFFSKNAFFLIFCLGKELQLSVFLLPLFSPLPSISSACVYIVLEKRVGGEELC